MSRISFQNEQPSELDVFPGGSHDKVASAMCEYIADEKNSRVIGLDGEFGSGKSSILKMLQQKLVKVDQKYKVWFFDCEQNYQGSIKSNFIELFTEELIDKIGSDKKVEESLKDSRDRALGRQFTYTKSTVSRVSFWALFLVIALFFSTSSFKELFGINKMKDPVIAWILVHIASLISPLIVLLIAHFKLKNTMVGDQPWSIFHLFKGGSDDTINEKIKVAKEVTPLDLKRTLEDDLKLVGDLHYVVILDNLDRLPKESLRAVWSDLEIFTWVSADNNFTVIVPFCSNKVAKYLAPENERTYDSRDFIAKKFPVVFRAPPIITAGWKDGFYQLWKNTFPDVSKDVAEKCALLLQRHSPMRNKLVTPRLQKRFINDIATTSLTLGDDIDIVCIGAQLLLCKYDELPLTEVIRANGLSDAYKEANPKFDDADLTITQTLLERHAGSDFESGWQIQFLQIHFLTDKAIAMAELIDEPLLLSVSERDGERFAELVSTFGFNDAFKRYLSKDVFNQQLIRVLADASEKLSEENLQRVISLLNAEGNAFQGDFSDEGDEFFAALKICRLAGLNTVGMERLKAGLTKGLRSAANDGVSTETLEVKRGLLKEYDLFMDALGDEPITLNISNAAYFVHVFTSCEDLKVVSIDHFKFTSTGLKSVKQHIVALPDSTEILPITETQRETLLNVLNGARRMGQELQVPVTDDEILQLSQSLANYPNNEAVLYGMALTKELPEIAITQLMSQSFENRTVNQNSAVAVALMAAKKFDALANVEGLDRIVESNVFKLLFRGAGNTDSLVSGYLDPAVGPAISKVWAWIIHDKAAWMMSYVYVCRNFSKIATAVSSSGINVQALFDWFAGWQHNFIADFDTLDKLDVLFVDKLVTSPAEQYKDFKLKVLEFYSSDRSSEEWEPILLSGSDNHNRLIKWSYEQEGFILAPTYRSCFIGILRKIMMGKLEDQECGRAIRSLAPLITVSDQAQKNLLGADLRDVVYVDGGTAESAVWLLRNFGHLIVDIQPANTAEVGRLMGLLDYLRSHAQTTDDVLAYLEGRAKQIASFNYSEELREAMAIAVTKLKKSAPKLYQAFAKRSMFKSIFKSILSSEKKAEQVNAELLKTAQASDQDASETKTEQPDSLSTLPDAGASNPKSKAEDHQALTGQVTDRS